ncbi:MAG: DUF5668 domain-containing protein [Chloroflexota bacterium]
MVVRNGRLFLGIVLILLGGLFLLQTLGLIEVSLWGLIIPVFLIALGVWGIWGATQARRVPVSEHVSVSMEGASRASVIVRYGAGRLHIRGGAAPGEALSGDFVAGMEYSARREGDLLTLDLRRPPEAWVLMGIPWTWSRTPEWTFQLTNDLPLSLRLETGACESEIDLRETQVHELRLQTGASATRLTLPARAGSTRAEIEAGAASIVIRVPEGVAARIRARGGLAEIAVDERRFPRVGSVHQSPDFETAAHRVDLDLQAGVGSVRVD